MPTVTPLTPEQFFQQYKSALNKRLEVILSKIGDLIDNGLPGLPAVAQKLLTEIPAQTEEPTGSCTYVIQTDDGLAIFCLDHVTEAECNTLGGQFLLGGTCPTSLAWDAFARGSPRAVSDKVRVRRRELRSAALESISRLLTDPPDKSGKGGSKPASR